MGQLKRLLIISLDGFTWRFGKSLIRDGYMPTFSALINEGCHGILKSVMPFETGPAWSSFQTGCLPHKTGIFCFHTYDNQSRRIRLNSYSDIQVATLWELLDKNSKKAICINMPLTSPPPKINGVIIPGLLCPRLNSDTVYPSGIYEQFIKSRNDYYIVNNAYSNTLQDFVEQSCRAEQTRCEVGLQLMDRYEWDVFYFQIQTTDLLQHRYWSGLDKDANGFNEADYHTSAVFYQNCNTIVSRLIEKADSETSVFIVSDHGFTRQRYSIAINRWLCDKGYLVLNLPTKSKWQQIKSNHRFLKLIAQGYGRLMSMAENINNRLSKQKPMPFSEIELLHLRQLVDFEQTKAFCLGGMAGIVYINPAEENKEGFVTTLKEALLKDYGPLSRCPLIKEIKTGLEEYGGPLDSVSLPDLIIEYQDGVQTVINPCAKEIVTDHTHHAHQPGTHDPDGVFVAHGPLFKRGYEYDANIVDIIPTVLAAMGLSVPRHMDGKVLTDIFTRPLKVQYYDASTKKTQATHYSGQEQSEVEKRLADLGYL